jgi:hypothetical protein
VLVIERNVECTFIDDVVERRGKQVMGWRLFRPQPLKLRKRGGEGG